jgi:hypothetical protein
MSFDLGSDNALAGDLTLWDACRMSLPRDFDLQPLTDPGDPDDWRPSSAWALVHDPQADTAVAYWRR